MNWLLPAQTLLDLISADPNPAQAWAASIDTQTLRVSVISIAEAHASIQSLQDAGLRSRLTADLTSFLALLKADAGPPLLFTEVHSAVWCALMHDPSILDVPQSDRQVYATAMHEGLAIVEEVRPETAILQALGVHIHVV